ncbi:MAG TPA: aminotransferase class III-fold pyridoxal phosphate-dependent enzyme, partial [Candidatus Dormibacteraeota bacterium]|nr:aminotransferase class III-fold pyridoxal phosphate-dependent enzyme [Candidatus Dormibacteraeota bacterium]
MPPDATNTRIDAGRLAELTQQEERDFLAKRQRSRALWEEAGRSMPRGVPSSFQDTPPQPVFIDRGKGSRVWDVDGNEYVDFHNGFGVMVVGHAHPAVVSAVNDQMARGSHFAQPVAEDVTVAEELARRFSQPKWRFTNSGT